jgi:glucose-6-phosphate 1-dehydrogenase
LAEQPRQTPRRPTLVLFGGGGDLAMRMLHPSLYFLEADRLLPDGLRIVAAARSEETQDAFLVRTREAVARRAPGGALDETAWGRYAGRLTYAALDATSAEDLRDLADSPELRDADEIVFYLATSPSIYAPLCAALGASGLAGPNSRVVLEKPIGRDLPTCRALNDAVAQVFSEDRVFRIDHYLGKETVQNLIALRFANTLFEPLWNNLSIDHVQITVAEAEGVGERWPYYDEYGALRDMVQNHILQMLCLVAMEPPSDLHPDSVRDEKVKVLRSLRPIGRAEVSQCTVRGQYSAGVVEGAAAAAYLEERGAPSETETFVALRADIDNWRWAGVPFFIRTGKRLPERRTEIVIQFKAVPHSIFPGDSGADIVANRLVMHMQPEEDINLVLMNKAPGLSQEGMRLEALPLSLSLGAAHPNARRRIAYERLLLDVLNNNSTLFVRRDEAEKAWDWVDGVTEAWARAGMTPKPYSAGSWGPAGAFALLERTGRAWHE